MRMLMPPGAIPAQGLQAIGRGDAQIVQGARVVQHAELAPGDLLDFRREPPVSLAGPNAFGSPVAKTLDHGLDHNARRYGGEKG